ncbi:DUF2750 domain-containing protein [Shewanella gelidii]|uniref:DUF2750 domain-containing protein n=1 Tax=Shewanella gelidii TaxID=1642821 RepID=A0A917JJQ1_9GAMM|nr:DUF2750 domain-containing protein [Shewanella gelidii]MCL1097003.1 DUF2750 domain-containing protein [Shewanella gelidii]GGI71854.1 hypothetical protein GCM10009332_06510 [Shewanella gelidii]
MSSVQAEASAFYKEVAKSGVVWGIKNKAGFPAPRGVSGKQAMPFWSSEKRAKLVIHSVSAYAEFEPTAIQWSDFCTHWVPGLKKDNFLAGINWSGKRASGFDIEPDLLQEAVETFRES